MYSDPISDMLTRVRNATKAEHLKVDVPASRLKVAIVDVWHKYGFVKNYRLFQQGGKGILRIYLKYFDKRRPVIQGLQRVSKSSRRVYSGYEDLPKVRGGIGVAVVSTSKGIVSDKVARENKVGGEVICKIW